MPFSFCVYSSVSLRFTKEQTPSITKVKLFEVQNLFMHQTFVRDVGWGRQKRHPEQKFHSSFDSSSFHLKCIISCLGQHPPFPDSLLLPRNLLNSVPSEKKTFLVQLLSPLALTAKPLLPLCSLAWPNPQASTLTPRQKLSLI